MTNRTSEQNRETDETQISLRLDVDGTGVYELDSGNAMFDHLLAQLSRHGMMDLTLKGRGDTDVGWHHLVEDVGLVLGRAMRECVGEGAGIVRMASAYAPLDEALARTVVDFSGRGYSVLELRLGDSDLGGLPADLVRHFLESFAREGGFNLHLSVLAGANNHHKAEAAFKSLARAIRAALTIDERQDGRVPSTKGTISG
jgi:imidazoleglycerol-phosphate dehydratase